MEKREYYLGLDMGTSSVGWAVTDPSYHLLRAKGKDMWGIREFEEANTSVERRGYRTSRRRKQREQVRIGLLRDYFKDEIDKVDPNFFARMDNSFFKVDDKEECVRYKNILFNDANFTDKDYNAKYPTVFHLIMDLINDQKSHDVRLVYLAVLNIFKHRGHFLNDSLSTEETNADVLDLYMQFRNLLAEVTGLSFPENVQKEKIEEILCDTKKARSTKSSQLSEYLGITKKDKQSMEILRALCGLKTDPNKMFDLEMDEKAEVNFSDSAYDEKASDLENKLDEDYFSVISVMKEFYDACAWNSVIKGYKYLSESRIASYEKHKADLKKLKSLIRENCSDEVYDRMFRSEEKGTYGDYVHFNNTDEKKRRIGDKHSQEDFYKEVEKILKTIPDSDKKAEIQDDLNNGSFMPKQLTASNGIIPYQAHYKELNAILSNAENYLPFLKEKTEDSDLTIKEQILKVFSFKIPYYIGPVTDRSEKDGGNGWVQRIEQGKILPWNIDTKIDMKKTSEKFIERLIRRCTYISGEPVLPKASLIYERYALLNEINSLAIDGERIPVELKQDIYNELFTAGKPVTKSRIAKYLQARKIIDSEDQLSGIDTRVNSTLSNYAKFFSLFGKEKMNLDKYKELAEDIVFYCTVYGDSRKFLVERLKENYSNELTDAQLKRISNFRFKDWGRFSKQFLLLQGADKSTGEVMTLLQALWETPFNMMELIHSDRFTFEEELAKKTVTTITSLQEFTYDNLKEMYFSAPVKRMVWQTLLIIREIEEIMGCVPKRVFVEMTRSDGEKGKRTISRQQKFLDLYKNVRDELHNWEEIINTAESNGTIRSKKMYLYLTQKGRDMYTGEPISLDSLFDDNLYDIDHIYPQSLVKDDNLDNNMVLVNKASNNHKQDIYPLEQGIRNKCMPLWTDLRQHGFMNEEKYKRLTGRTGFSDEQLEGFIARQIVETGQATKGITDILKQVLPDSKVVYSKAKNVSDFRQKFGLEKSRLVNDFHHANDAYLNIVVGNTYYSKFTDNPKNFIKNRHRDHDAYKYNMGRFFEYDVEGAWKGCGKQQTDGQYQDKGSIVNMSGIVAAGKGDLTSIGESKSTGVMLIPKKITGMKECKLIKQSVTGLKEQVIDLLTI